MSNCHLRLACEDDLAAINDIFNHYVVHTTSTYTIDPITPDQRLNWFSNRSANHPVTVVELDGRVVAWGALGSFRPLAGYRNTVENSVYVHPDFTHQGLGSMILADQIRRAMDLGLQSIVAVIDAQQAASIAAHAKHGYVEMGRLNQVGTKFEKLRDIVLMQWLPPAEE